MSEESATAVSHRFEYCPRCGEKVDRGLTDEAGVASCDNCCEYVEPIGDADDAEMPFKAQHPIKCSDCRQPVQLVGLHMGRYTDGVLAACDCTSLESLPYELGEPELPSQWEIWHDEEIHGDDDPENEPAAHRQEVGLDGF